LAAPFYSKNWDSVDLGWHFSRNSFAHGEDVWMLHQDQGIGNRFACAKLNQLALKHPDVRIVLQA